MTDIGPCDWHMIDEELAVSAIQKNASTALAYAFPRRIGAEQALEVPVRLAWIRHPLARVKSVYSNLFGAEVDGIKAYHKFVDHMLEVENAHWVPQMRRLYFEGTLVPNKFEKFENIQERWSQYCKKVLPRVNGTEPLVTDDYREEDLLEYYEADLKQWETI